MGAGDTWESRKRILTMLLRSSLAKGHFRVAWQRLLIMEACGMDAPDELRAACETYSPRLRPADWRRMREAASDFAEMIRAFARVNHCTRQGTLHKELQDELRTF